MDSMDIRILERLQQDGRITLSQLSRELHLSHPSIAERIKRLQEQGVIEKFTAHVPPQSVGRTLLAIVQIGDIRIACKEFENKIHGEPSVMECHRVTGDFSYFIKIAVNTMEDLEGFVDRLLPFCRVNTSVVLSSPMVERSMLPLETDEEIK